MTGIGIVFARRLEQMLMSNIVYLSSLVLGVTHLRASVHVCLGSNGLCRRVLKCLANFVARQECASS